MLKPIDYIIGNMVLILYTYYAWRKISHQTIKVKWIYVILTSLLIMILSIINFTFTNIFIRFAITTFILTIANMVIYKNQIKQALLLSMISQLILFGGEICYVFIIMLTCKLFPIPTIDKLFGALLSNLIIVIFSIHLFYTCLCY